VAVLLEGLLGQLESLVVLLALQVHGADVQEGLSGVETTRVGVDDVLLVDLRDFLGRLALGFVLGGEERGLAGGNVGRNGDACQDENHRSDEYRRVSHIVCLLR